MANSIVGSNFTLPYLRIETNLILLIVWIAALLLGFIFFTRPHRKLNKITNSLNFLSIFLVIFALIPIVTHEIKLANARNIEKSRGARMNKSVEIAKIIIGQPISTAKNPNIYYIVVDAYANNSILKEVYGYDNSEFLNFLSKKGFYVADASHSNYDQTSLSIASSLNLKYLDSALSNADIESNNLDFMGQMIDNNEVFDFLKKCGYTIVAFQSGYSKTEIEKADIYLTSGYSSDESKSALLNTTPLPSLSNAMNEDPRFETHREIILHTLGHIIDTAKFKGPIFVFAHIEVPHPPFVFGPNGKSNRVEGEFNEDDGDWLIKQGRITYDEYVNGYVNQILFLNKKLMGIVNALLSQSSEKPIIILQSDHGPRARLAWENPARTYFKECMSILNAYYFPDGDYNNLYDSITPVNTFRVILSQYYSGTDYGLLKDESYFSTASHPYNFIDVTGTLN